MNKEKQETMAREHYRRLRAMNKLMIELELALPQSTIIHVMSYQNENKTYFSETFRMSQFTSPGVIADTCELKTSSLHSPADFRKLWAEFTDKLNDKYNYRTR